MPVGPTSLLTAASLLLAQAGPEPLDRPGAAGQVWPFLLAGLFILAVVVWGLAGGIKKRHGH
jgi:hypothetical protein